MSETKHTPGPWVVGETLYRGADGGKHGYREIWSKHDVLWVARVLGFTHGDVERYEANARLIAAAPDMLREYREDDQLLMQMAPTFFREDIANFIPFGLAEKVKARLRRGTPALAKAEGRE